VGLRPGSATPATTLELATFCQVGDLAYTPERAGVVGDLAYTLSAVAAACASSTSEAGVFGAVGLFGDFAAWATARRERLPFRPG
jgi:hypothetical protein